MNDDLHAVVGKIIDMLEAQGCWHETFHHQAVGAIAIILRVKPLLCALNQTLCPRW